jgi:diaminopimelate decarboxylase
MTALSDTPLQWHDGELHMDGVMLRNIAEQHGTPCYVYSLNHIQERFEAYARGLGTQAGMICFAVKSNANLSVLQALARAGCGFDIVSGGEMARALAAGADPKRILFSGVGKSSAEITEALHAGIGCFNIESVPELERISGIAASIGRPAPVSLRINPDVDARTHPYISTGLKGNKFGIPAHEALSCYRLASSLPAIRVVGIDCHIGSQITQLAPYLEAAERVLDLVDALEAEGICLEHIDLGGGLGIRYQDDDAPPDVTELVRALSDCLARRGHGHKKLVLEPGRSLVGNAGVLLTRVEYIKPGETRNFAIVDAAMNDMMRPTLYDAWMNVIPVSPRPGPSAVYDIVGPVCESGDWLAHDRELAIASGDLLAICSAGAYGMTMASNYNSRVRPPEVLVRGSTANLVRPRETLDDLFASEVQLLSEA